MMRKYLIGIVIGVFLASTVPAYAEETVSLIGRTIEGVFAVQIEGNKLEKEALVVDGTTYLPVRAFGEALGYEVSFDPEMGVSMKKKVDPVLQEKIKADAKEQIQIELDILRKRLKGNEDMLKYTVEQKAIDAINADIEATKKKIAELEAKLAQ